MAITGLYDKMVMDANTNATLTPNMGKKQLKHLGEYKESKTPVIVLFRTVPKEPNNCLIVAPKFLPDVYNEAIMKAVDSDGGQAESELGTYLHRQRFPNGENMLELLHNQNYIKKILTDKIDITYGVGIDGRVSLDELNKLIAKSKGVKVNELAINDPTATKEETKKAVVKDAKKSTKKT